MRYKISHSTRYSYSAPVPVCHNQVLLTPRDGERLTCTSARLRIVPTPTTLARRRDTFGNHLHVFSIEEAHKELLIVATSRVQILPPPLRDPPASTPWEVIERGIREQTDPNWLEASPFVFDSPLVSRDAECAGYGQQVFGAGRPILEALLELISRIHRDFRYDKGATGVETSSFEVFRARHGVCQDFAHVGIACLRSIGIPARYVSGYLRTIPPPGEPRLIGADQSHAWFSAYCGDALGWVDVDPTNNMACATDHVTVAWGRDYRDVAPVRGVLIGGGENKLDISVDVEPLEPRGGGAAVRVAVPT